MSISVLPMPLVRRRGFLMNETLLGLFWDTFWIPFDHDVGHLHYILDISLPDFPVQQPLQCKELRM